MRVSASADAAGANFGERGEARSAAADGGGGDRASSRGLGPDYFGGGEGRTCDEENLLPDSAWDARSVGAGPEEVEKETGSGAGISSDAEWGGFSAFSQRR